MLHNSIGFWIRSANDLVQRARAQDLPFQKQPLTGSVATDGYPLILWLKTLRVC